MVCTHRVCSWNCVIEKCSWNVLMNSAHGNAHGCVLMRCTHEMCSWHVLVRATRHYFSPIPSKCAHDTCSWNVLMEHAPCMCSRGPRGMISAPFPQHDLMIYSWHVLMNSTHEMCSWICSHEVRSWSVLMACVRKGHEALFQPHSLGMRS